jgi:hypothetical protein
MGSLSGIKKGLDAANKALKTRRAYHGTPHDFDKFSMDKIGTGEGAQAYGHGLYFSGKKEIAEHYKKNVSRSDIRRNFLDTLPEDAEFDEILDLLGTGTFNESQERVIKALDADDWLGFDYPSQAINTAYSNNLKNYDVSPELSEAVNKTGKLYEVEIPDESLMLDWDKPLSEQPEIMQQLGDAGLLQYDRTGLPRFKLTGEHFMSEMHKNGARAEVPSPDGTLKSASMPRKEWVSTKLREAGIPGITYKGATSDERNFVVLDDELVNISNKYAAAPIGLMAQDFIQKRQEKKSYWDELKGVGQAAATVGSAMAGGAVSDLSKLGGYLNPFIPVEESEASANAMAEQMQYIPADENKYLDGIGRAIENIAPYVQPYMDRVEQAWPQSVPGQMYNALPQRAQGVLKTSANLL